jgi:hypothetical protein
VEELMATRSEQFRAEQQRVTHHRPKQPVKGPKRRDTDDDGARNLSHHGDRSATVVTEESFSGHTSRKSTRASAHHKKGSAVLDRVARAKSNRPDQRHQRRS